MKAETRELFDLALLRVLDANRTRFGLGLTALGHCLLPFGFSPANCGVKETFEELVADRVEYLVRKGMVEEVQKTMERDVRAWRITNEGIRYVDERG